MLCLFSINALGLQEALGGGAIEILMQRPGIKPVSGKHSTSEPPMLKWEDFGSSLINQNLIVLLQNIISNPYFRV